MYWDESKLGLLVRSEDVGALVSKAAARAQGSGLHVPQAEP